MAQTSPEHGEICQRPRRRLIPLMVMLLSASLAAAGLEIGLRLFRPEPWWKRVAGEQKPELGVQIAELDGIKVRFPPTEDPKRAGECRIMFLGDSFTFGYGVRLAKDTFVGRLQERLNSSAPIPGIERYELFNGGAGGSYTRHWLSLHRQLAGKFQPDLVVAVFFLRDGAPPEITTLGMIRQIEEGMNRLENESALYRCCHVYRFLRDRVELHRLSDKYLGIIRSSYFGDAAQTKEWRAAKRNLLRIKRQTEALGGRFALVVFPVLFELNDEYPLADVCDRIAEFCRANDIPVLSLLPALLGRNAASLWVSVFNQHPNELGHEIAAGAMYPFIVDLVRAAAAQRR